MTDILDSWFIRHFETAMPALIMAILFGGFTLLAYGLGPAPSEHDAVVVYGLLGFLGAVILLGPRLFIRWVGRPL